MSAALFVILCAQTLGVIIWAFMRAERINYFSSLLAICMAGFALPQIIGLMHRADSFPPGAMEKTLLMTNLCFGCALIGFHMNVQPSKRLNWNYTPDALLFMSAALTLVGGACYFKITRLPENMLNMGQWSGIVTIYNFFASALPCGLVISVYLLLKRPSFLALILAMISGLLILDRAMMGGRRSQAISLALIIFISLWLFKGKTMPRALFLASALVGCLAIYSIADYRNAVGGGKAFNSIFLGGGLEGLKGVSDIHFFENAGNVTKEGSTEYEAAVYGIADADETMTFDFGLARWDALVHHFVPAQFLGQDFKESLQFNLNASAASSSGFQKAGSTSEPGMVDAFRSFWYFGCLEFLLIGYLMRLLLNSARAGNLNFAFAYITVMCSAMVIISHPLDFFIEELVHSALLFGAVVLAVRLFRRSAIVPFSLAPQAIVSSGTLSAGSTPAKNNFYPETGSKQFPSLPRFVPATSRRPAFMVTRARTLERAQ